MDYFPNKLLLLMSKKTRDLIDLFPVLLLSKMRSTGFTCYLHEVQECCNNYYKVTDYLEQVS